MHPISLHILLSRRLDSITGKLPRRVKIGKKFTGTIDSILHKIHIDGLVCNGCFLGAVEGANDSFGASARNLCHVLP